MNGYTTRASCRVCGSTNLEPLFSIGEQYVSDFVDYSDILKGIKCPIELEQCRSCTLVQAKHTAPQELLYKGTYWYRSSVTETMRLALLNVVNEAKRRVELGAGDIVLDIGSNDGHLLRCWKAAKPEVVTVGVEPASNLAEEGAKGVDIFIDDFWSAEVYGDYVYEYENPAEGKGKLLLIKAKVVTACGMFYDLEDPNQFIADVAKVLDLKGIFVTQLMCAKQMLEKGDIGNLSHEHLEFYTLQSLSLLFRKHRLEIFDVEENDINGGSYRLYIRHIGNTPGMPGEMRCRKTQTFLKEDRLGLDKPETYLKFFQEACANKEKVVRFINEQKRKGKRIWVYGSSTKGNVLLQWYKIDSTEIDAAADRSPEKWGRYTVGTKIPIKSEDEFRKANPEFALVLPYAFLPEFINREEEWLAKGNRFIVPLPKPRLVGLSGTSEYLQ